MARPAPVGPVGASLQMVQWPVGPVKVLLPHVLEGTETPEERATVFHATVTQLDAQNQILDHSDMVAALLHIMQCTQVGASKRKRLTCSP